MLPESSFNSLQQDGLLDSATHKGEYLIVTADDFGYDNERDQGIIKAFTDGIVTRASLIINGYSARRSAIKLSQEHGLALGLHLNLTEGKPVCENDISSLTSEGSCFFRGKFGFREALSRGDIDMCHVKNEIEAQLQEFIKHVGYLPNHVNGHQHIHVLPEVQDIVAHVMSTNSLHQIRIPLESQLGDWLDANHDFYNKVFEQSRMAMGVYKKHNIRFPERFMGISLMGRHMNVARIIQTYQATKKNQESPISACELMVHPGYPSASIDGGCGEGPDDFACSNERQHELKVLCDPELRKTLADLHVKFIS